MPQPIRPPVLREDGTVAIQLTRGYEAIIDPEDAHLAGSNWYALVTPSGLVYAARKSSTVSILLHREIMGLPPGRDPIVDHKDGDGLNCRRSNMRVTTFSENLRNKGVRRDSRTGYVGVNIVGSRFIATICGRTIGRFDTAEEAHAARLSAELEEWGVQPRRRAEHGQ